LLNDTVKNTGMKARTKICSSMEIKIIGQNILIDGEL